MMRMKNFIQSILLIIVLVSTIAADTVIYAQVGEQVTLTPTFSQVQYVYWFFEKLDGVQLAWHNHLGGKAFINDEKWKNRLSIHGASLVISDFQQEFFGTFVCKTTSGSKTNVIVYKVIQINVDVKPDSLLLSGDTLSLTCNLNSTSQVQNTPTIYWLNPQDKREGANKGKVSVRAKIEHNGQWSCVVKDSTNEKKVHVSVTVVGFIPVSSPQYVSADSSLTIPCSIRSGITWEQILKMEVEVVQWDFAPKLSSGAVSANQEQLFHFDLVKKSLVPDRNKGLRPVSSYKNKQTDLSLIKSKARVEDRGRYTCAMKFKNGTTLISTVDVEVLQITSHPGTELIYGQQVNLSCSTGDQLPNGMKLNWTQPDTSSTYFYYPTHITIPEVTKRHSGKWTCELWRGGDKLTSAEILLKTEPRLSVWMLVIICSAAVILLLLLVLVFIHYRRRQQKMRVLRHRLCQCKNPKPKGFYRT